MNMGVSDGGLFAKGTLIANRYEVVSVLGTGAMGTVVRVIDRALDKEVCALKLLHPHQARDEVSFARFRNEVILARRIGHPHIARIYDIGLAGGGYYYISMEYISGGSLNQVIYQQRREHFVFRDSLRMLSEIAEGIAYAHKIGVVHRDLKPENILLGDRSEIKITDFGLARSLNSDKGFTDTGETVGTPCYMSPEQLRGERVDGRCDIYALGIIAFELVVGRRPFFDESYFALAAMHMRQPIPDFATKESGIPKWFEEFVKRCAAKDPADRYQDAYEIVEELREQTKNLSSEGNIQRAPAVMSFYAPTKKHRSAPKRIASGMRWIAASALVLTALIGSLWVNGLGPAGIVRALHVALQGGERAVASPSELFSVIEQGDVEKLNAFLREDERLTQITYSGETPLIAAARTGRLEATHLLLKAGADVNAPGQLGTTPLMSSVERPGRQVTDLLLEYGADVNARDGGANTALMYAIRRGNAAVAQILLEHGALVNTRNEKNQTALFDAVLRKDSGMVQMLLSRNAEANVQDSAGRTPLSYAAEFDDETMVRALIQKGGDPNLRDLSDKVPADYAGRRTKRLLGQQKAVAEMPPPPTPQPTPPPAANDQTRLRTIGDPQFVVEMKPSGPQRMARQTVRNVGSSTAKQVSVTLQMMDGKTLTLTGPTELEANGTQVYSAPLPGGSTGSPRDKVLVSCSNCWK